MKVFNLQMIPKVLEDLLPPAKFMLKIETGDLQHRCSGCRVCEMVCSLYHEGECNPSLSRIHVNRNLFDGNFTPEVCFQCVVPDCLLACPIEGAFCIDEHTGARIINKDKCPLGCDLCVDACKFKMVGFNEERQTVFKCDLCGGEPKCVEFCPSGIIKLVEVD